MVAVTEEEDSTLDFVTGMDSVTSNTSIHLHAASTIPSLPLHSLVIGQWDHGLPTGHGCRHRRGGFYIDRCHSTSSKHFHPPLHNIDQPFPTPALTRDESMASWTHDGAYLPPLKRGILHLTLSLGWIRSHPTHPYTCIQPQPTLAYTCTHSQWNDGPMD